MSIWGTIWSLAAEIKADLGIVIPVRLRVKSEMVQRSETL
jgi:hypothetical protein